ncbi:MAG: EAL domain-containing protein [Micavibrio sp.]
METEQNRRIFRAGDIIVRAGEKNDHTYIIERGTVGLFRAEADMASGSEAAPLLQSLLETRGAGALIGDNNLGAVKPFPQTIQALEECEALVLTKDDFARLLMSPDPVTQSTAKIILARSRLERTAQNEGNDAAPPLDDADIESLSADFKKALGTKQVSLHYQPIMNFRTGFVDGFEALMRWNHPEKGEIPPSVFISAIEKTGLIVDATRWALRKACRALKRIESRIGLERPLFMSVNFSPVDFAEENFLDQLYTILSETDAAAAEVHLEITETLLMGQPKNAWETLSLCKKAGLGISIDDFAMEHSSLAYLHYYPINSIKIDQLYIRSMFDDPAAFELITAILALARHMDISVTAEGIETQQEAETLARLGCHRAQGYFFSHPLAESALTDKLLEWRREGLLD